MQQVVGPGSEVGERGDTSQESAQRGLYVAHQERRGKTLA